MARAVAALAAACALLACAAPAGADVRHAALGDTAASLSSTGAGGGSIDHLRLRLTVAGTAVFDAPITTLAGRPGALERTPPVRRFLGAELRVLDLDGDGTGEAVIDLAEPGAYCCSHTVIVGRGPGGAYRRVELDVGSFGAAPTYVRSGPGYVLVSRDARLEERYTPHVLSFEPVRLWTWAGGALRDVSHDQPVLVRRDLRDLRRVRAQLLRRPDRATIDLRGLLAAIAGDRVLLGQRARAARELHADVAAGRARVASAGGPTNRAYARDVVRVLARLGY